MKMELPRSAVALTVAAIFTAGAAFAATRPPVHASGYSGVELSYGSALPVLTCPGPPSLTVPSGGRALPTGGPVILQGVFGTATPTPTGELAPLSQLRMRNLQQQQQQSMSKSVTWGDFAGVAQLSLNNAGAFGLSTSGSIGAASQLSYGRSGELRGLAGLACQQARDEWWLVGGGTSRGQRNRLLLVNPTASPVAASVEVYGTSGTVSANSVSHVGIPAGGQTAVMLEALVPDIDATAVHVTTDSGSVAAWLWNNQRIGALGAGVDAIAPVPAPTTRTIVPGVMVRPPSQVGLQILVPGHEDAVVQVSAMGSRGTKTISTAAKTVPGGRVSVIGVPLPAGTYTLGITSDVPIVAAAAMTRISDADSGNTTAASQPGGRLTELAWASAAASWSGTAWVAIARINSPSLVRGSTATVVVANDTDKKTDVLIQEIGFRGQALGNRRTMAMAPRTSQALELASHTAAVTVAGTAIEAAVIITAQDRNGPLLTVSPVSPPQQLSEKMTRLHQDSRLGASR